MNPIIRTNFRGILFLIATLFCPILSAQVPETKEHNSIIVEANYTAGKVIPTYPNFPKTSFTQGFEMFVGYEASGKKRWHKLFNYPRLGMSFMIQDLGNNRELGQLFAAVPTVYFSTAKREDQRVSGEIRYGMGLAYFNNPFDSIHNKTNFGAGAHFTWQIIMGGNLRIKLYRNTSLQLGGAWYHSSDAHTKLPNVGINNFTFYAGILTYPFGRMKRIHTHDTVSVDKKWHANLRLGVGYQRRGSTFGPYNSPAYPVYTLALYGSKRFGGIFLLKFGALYRYYSMYHSFNSDFHVFNSNQILNSSCFTLFFGNEFLLGHIAISMEAGVNVFKPAYKAFFNYYESSSRYNYITKQYIATRFGVNYYLFDPYKHPSNNISAGVYVVANMGQAEFMEFNLGYVF